jgi:hypothetical protein
VLARALRWVSLAVAGLLALALLGLAAVPWLLDTPRIQAYIAHAAGQVLGRPVHFAAVSVSAFPLPAVRIRGLSVAEDPRFGTGAFITVADGRVGIKLRPLLVGRVELGDVALDGVRLSLVEAGGQWNATLGGARGAGRRQTPGAVGGGGVAGAGAVFARVRVANGAVGPAATAAPPASGSRAWAPDRPAAAATRSCSRAAPRAAGAVHLGSPTARSRAAEPAARRRPVRATCVEAPDVRPLAAAVLDSAELSGALDGTLALRGTLGRLSGDGELRAARVVLSQARPRCGAPLRRELTLEQVRLPVAFAPPGVELARAEARSGGGTVSLRLGLRLSPAPLATATDIAISALPLKPILADYACQPSRSGPGRPARRSRPRSWRTLAPGRFRGARSAPGVEPARAAPAGDGPRAAVARAPAARGGVGLAGRYIRSQGHRDRGLRRHRRELPRRRRRRLELRPRVRERRAPRDRHRHLPHRGRMDRRVGHARPRPVPRARPGVGRAERGRDRAARRHARRGQLAHGAAGSDRALKRAPPSRPRSTRRRKNTESCSYSS